MGAAWGRRPRAGARGPVSQWVTVNGLRMHARASRGAPPADAPTIVLVHGLGMSSRYMEPLLDELAPYARVFAPDLPGYGRSASPRKRLTLAGMADALDAWMGAVGIDSAVVAGNSLGAQVIAQLGVRHPDRLTRAVLIGPTRDPSVGRAVPAHPAVGPRRTARAPRPDRGGRTRLPARRSQADVPLVRRSAAPPRGGPTAPSAGADADRAWGARPDLTQGWVEQINRLVPTSRLAVIEGAPHAVNFSAAPQLAREIRAFLADTRNSRRAFATSILTVKVSRKCG